MKQYSVFKFTNTNSTLLDLIRFLCAEFVVLAHINEYHPDKDFWLLENAGNFAVGVFFILSGLLISNSCWNKISAGKYTFKSYFADRFVRIYSALLPSLVLVLLIDFLAFALCDIEMKNSSVSSFVGNMAMLQEYPLIDNFRYYLNDPDFDWLRVPFFGSDLPLWTLSIEWWIYMLFGWIIIAMKRARISWWLGLAFLSIVPLYQLFIGSRMGAGLTLFWFIGVLLSILLRKRGLSEILKPQRAKHLVPFFFLLSVSCYFVGEWKFAVGIFSISVLVALFLGQKNTRPKKSIDTGVKFLADYSFTLYLVHYPLLRLTNELLHLDSVILSFMVNLIICNLVSALVAELFEKKHRTLRKYCRHKLKV